MAIAHCTSLFSSLLIAFGSFDYCAYYCLCNFFFYITVLQLFLSIIVLQLFLSIIVLQLFSLSLTLFF